MSPRQNIWRQRRPRWPAAVFHRRITPGDMQTQRSKVRSGQVFKVPRRPEWAATGQHIRRICRPLHVPWSKAATFRETEHSRRTPVDIYSPKNLLVCGAQFARTHNTVVFMRTRKPRSVERQTKPAVIFGFWHKLALSESAASFARERLIRADTAHYVSGFAPFGGAAQFER